MKKRLVAVMLGLTLSLATVGEAGAAAFSSPDSETVQAEITETENAAVFSAGDGDEQDAQTDDADHIQDEFSSDAEDELSTGTAGTVVTDGSLEDRGSMWLSRLKTGFRKTDILNYAKQ